MTTEFDPVKYLDGLPRDASITDAEVRKMYELGMELPEGAVLMELGVWQGRSAVLLAMIADHRHGMFYGIDHFRHPGCSKRAVVERLIARGLIDSAAILEAETSRVETVGMRVDFLHVDADHCSPGFDRDCAQYLPLVKARGIVAFDDYVVLPTEPAYPDIKRVADQWCANLAWEDLGQADGMKFFRRRP